MLRLYIEYGKPLVVLKFSSHHLHFNQDTWKDGRRWQLTIATELPELEEKQLSNRGDRGFGSGNRGDRGGFRGGRGRSFGGNRGRGYGFRSGGGGFRNNDRGQKRSFNQAFDY